MIRHLLWWLESKLPWLWPGDGDSDTSWNDPRLEK